MSNNEGRAKLSHDFSVIGEGIPMMSADGWPLEVDTVVYSGSVTCTSSGGRYTNESKAYQVNSEIEALRVVQLNFKERYVRVRNKDGCEQTLSFHEGCTRLKVYKDFDTLKAKLHAMLEREMAVTLDRIALRTKLLEDLAKVDKNVAKLKPPPSPVKTGKVLPKKGQKLPEEA